MADYKVWECLVCGWVYDESKGWPEDGIEAGTRWEDVPEDWLCPECGVGKDDFEMILVEEAESSSTDSEEQAEAEIAVNSAPVVIIGSGLAGYNLVRELRKLDAATPLTVITSDDGCFYSKPLISTGFHKGKSADEMATASAAEMEATYNISVRTFSTVTAIDSSAQTLEVNGQQLSYSKLVLANGASCIEAPLAGKCKDQVYSVNNLMDYARFRAAMTRARKALIIGAGLIGCEYANDLIQSGYEVEVVDPLPIPLANLLPPTASRSVQIALEAAGVKFNFGTIVKSVNRGRNGSAVSAKLSDGKTIDADIVLSAIGVRPRTEIANAAGLETNRGIVVDRTLRTSAPNIYALGDCAEVDGHVLYYVAPLMASARALAKTLTGTPTAVHYGTMPVIVKTTLFPVVANPPAASIEGEWAIEESTTKGVKAVFKATNGEIAGFALTGECTKERDNLAGLTLPIMA
ncbi:FAD-dependent oxidoreductase [Biformimicrobium ophioploci]|uniref:FAD-dependent oxidoreductase n=1 Tax=Biformimicrobium ophioploci TaxID=3036711 RepID=A0ABQ6M287_9GAMM|nr:FAD-dependent oxidoreductase [Microbulbifer sp. NKW57]GMG88407.1 FAD-dependent oxidoreductase [Microbulbifer sp. NKW57]